MQIEQNEVGVNKVLNRRDRGRILAMFSIIDKLDSSDIIKITGLHKSRVSDAMIDLEGLSFLQVSKPNKKVSVGNTQKYYFLYPPNSEISKLFMQKFVHDLQFERDKTRIIELLSDGGLTGIKK